MKPNRKIAWLAPVFFLPLFAVAQEEGYPFRLSNFKLDLYGGYARVAPSDFNSIADYEESYLQFYYVQRYSSLGPDFKVTAQRTGDDQFRHMTYITPWGGRIHYQLSPTLSISLGAQYLKGRQDSNVGMDISVTGGSGALTDQYENLEFGLSLSAWLPQLGAHFGWDLGPVFRPEIFILFGPMIVECRSFNTRQTARTDWDGYRLELSETVEMKGRKTTLSGELGGALRLHIAKFLDLFTEGSYIFRVADELKGPGWSQTVRKDSNLGESSFSSNWEGTWRLASYNTVTSWGQFRGSMPNNAYDWGPSYKRFSLDLSGIQLKAGLSIRL